MRGALLAVVLAGIAIEFGMAADPLTLVGTIDLPRVEVGIDHLAFDPATQRLYVAALGNNTVEVLDVNARTHLKSLPGFASRRGSPWPPTPKRWWSPMDRGRVCS